MQIKVEEKSEDGLFRKLWQFNQSQNYIFLVSYSEQTRETKRHGFKGKKWSSYDERSYYSALDRPTEIPAWVIREAVLQLNFQVSIGWTSQEHVIGQVKLCDVLPETDANAKPDASRAL